MFCRSTSRHWNATGGILSTESGRGGKDSRFRGSRSRRSCRRVRHLRPVVGETVEPWFVAHHPASFVMMRPRRASQSPSRAPMRRGQNIQSNEMSICPTWRHWTITAAAGGFRSRRTGGFARECGDALVRAVCSTGAPCLFPSINTLPLIASSASTINYKFLVIAIAILMMNDYPSTTRRIMF